MHPFLLKRGRLGLYLLAWLPVGLLLAALLALSDPRPWWEALIFCLPMVVVFAFLSLGAWPVCRSVPLGRTPAIRLLGTHVAASVITGGFWSLLGAGWGSLISRFPRLGDTPRLHQGDLPLVFVAGTLLFMLSAIVHYLLIAFEESAAAERRALGLEVLAREAELKALKAQINPHFLFNSLNSISALAGTDPAAARRMCRLLADFLRMTLRLGAARRIPLSEELALARGFLAVEQVRFGSRLSVHEEIDPSVTGLPVPPLLLLPLVENAVSHGIASRLEGGTVRIGARTSGGLLEIEVENPCDPDPTTSRGGGLGLANVRGRVESLGGVDARVDVFGGPDTFKVVLRLPAEDSRERPDVS